MSSLHGLTPEESWKTSQTYRKNWKVEIRTYQPLQGVNLYVKNLDDLIDNKCLHKEFSLFGTITSAKVITDKSGKLKGFSFVSFEESKSAESAITDINGTGNFVKFL